MNGWEDGFHNNHNHHNAILLPLLLRHVICRATILTIRYVRFWAEPSHRGRGAAMALESGASFLASKNFGKIPLLNYCRGSVPPPCCCRLIPTRSRRDVQGARNNYVFENNIRRYPSGHLVPSLYLIHPAIQLTRLTPSSMDIGYRDFFFLISLHSERCTTSSIPRSLPPSLQSSILLRGSLNCVPCTPCTYSAYCRRHRGPEVERGNGKGRFFISHPPLLLFPSSCWEACCDVVIITA